MSGPLEFEEEQIQKREKTRKIFEEVQKTDEGKVVTAAITNFVRTRLETTKQVRALVVVMAPVAMILDEDELDFAELKRIADQGE